MGERGREKQGVGGGVGVRRLKAEWESRLGAQHKGLLMSPTSLHTLNATWLSVRIGEKSGGWMERGAQ